MQSVPLPKRDRRSGVWVGGDSASGNHEFHDSFIQIPQKPVLGFANMVHSLLYEQGVSFIQFISPKGHSLGVLLFGGLCLNPQTYRTAGYFPSRAPSPHIQARVWVTPGPAGAHGEKSFLPETLVFFSFWISERYSYIPTLHSLI